MTASRNSLHLPETDDEERPEHPHPGVFSDSEVGARQRRRGNSASRDSSRRSNGRSQQSPAFGSNQRMPTLEPAIETDHDENEEDIPSDPYADPYSDPYTADPHPQYQRNYDNRERDLRTPLTIPVPERQFMDHHDSYHGAISGEEAVKRLKRANNDSYLCRYSSGNQKYVLTLVKHEIRRMGHFQLAIDRSSRRKYRVEGMEKHFGSIHELLTFYETNRIHPEFDNIGNRLTLQDYASRMQRRRCIVQ